MKNIGGRNVCEFESPIGQLANVCVAGFVLCGVLTADVARADVRDFPFTYEWRQSQA